MHDEGGVSPAPGGESGHNALTEEDSANEIAHISVRPPSCTEMEEMLRRILHPLDTDLPPSKILRLRKWFYFVLLLVFAILICTLCSRCLNSLFALFVAASKQHLRHGLAA